MTIDKFIRREAVRTGIAKISRMTSEVFQVYVEGYNARLSGVRYSDNPYKDFLLRKETPDKWKAWNIGHDVATRDLEGQSHV